MRDRPNAASTFMAVSCVMATRSHDPRTQHGSTLTDPNKHILGVGYNGYPRGMKDNTLPQEAPEKYKYIIHAEDNCLMNARIHLAPEGSVIYVTGHPCVNCLLKIIQMGVKKVIYGGVMSHCIQDSDIVARRTLVEQSGIQMVPFDTTLPPTTVSNIGLLETLDMARETAEKVVDMKRAREAFG